MNRITDLFYWLGHGFTLAEAWNYARDPRTPPTPAWRVYTAAACAVIGLAGAITSFFY